MILKPHIWIIEDKTYDDISREMGINIATEGYKKDFGPCILKVLRSREEAQSELNKVDNILETLIVFLDLRLSIREEIRSDLKSTGGYSLINSLSQSKIENIYLYIWSTAQMNPAAVVEDFCSASSNFKNIVLKTQNKTKKIMDGIVFSDKNDVNLMKKIIDEIIGSPIYNIETEATELPFAE